MNNSADSVPSVPLWRWKYELIAACFSASDSGSVVCVNCSSLASISMGFSTETWSIVQSTWGGDGSGRGNSGLCAMETEHNVNIVDGRHINIYLSIIGRSSRLGVISNGCACWDSVKNLGVLTVEWKKLWLFRIEFGVRYSIVVQCLTHQQIQNKRETKGPQISTKNHTVLANDNNLSSTPNALLIIRLIAATLSMLKRRNFYLLAIHCLLTWIKLEINGNFEVYK